MGVRSLLVLAVLLSPVSALAQGQVILIGEEEPGNYVTFYYARNGGGDLFRDRDPTDGFGIGYTFWAPGPLAAELDFGYNPDFLGTEEELGQKTNLLTFTLSGIIGPWIHAGNNSFRPYAVIGGGLMRSNLREFGILGEDSRNRGVVDLGGGLLYLYNRKVGVRGDVRYHMGVGEKDDEDGWGFLEDFNYVRFSVGLSLGF
jgi:hypothetical protein